MRSWPVSSEKVIWDFVNRLKKLFLLFLLLTLTFANIPRHAGAIAGGDRGAEIGYAVALSAEANNRQLHQKEIEWIKSHAGAFAKSNGLTQRQARLLLTLGALGMVDAEKNAELQRLVHKGVLKQEQLSKAREYIKGHVVQEGATFQDEHRHYGDELVSEESKTQMMFTASPGQYFDSGYDPNTDLGGLIDNLLDIIPIAKEFEASFSVNWPDR